MCERKGEEDTRAKLERHLERHVAMLIETRLECRAWPALGDYGECCSLFFGVKSNHASYKIK